MSVVGIDKDETLSESLGFPLAVVDNLGGEDVVAGGEDIVDGKVGLLGRGVVDPMHDDGMDIVIVKIMIKRGLVKDSAIEVSLSLDLLFAKENGDGAARHDRLGERPLMKNRAILFAEVTDGNGEFCGGGIFDAVHGKSLLKKPDRAFAAEKTDGFSEDQHGKPAVKEAGVDKGFFQITVEDQVV